MLLMVYGHSISHNLLIVCRERADRHHTERYRTDVHNCARGNESTEACSGTTYVLIKNLFIIYYTADYHLFQIIFLYSR